MMNVLTRLVDETIPVAGRDGGVIDLGRPDHEVVCFVDMAHTLSKIPRFNGRNFGIGLSVAQHCVMGAQAIMNEGGSKHDAALFLLHDGHEWVLGDIITPTVRLLSAFQEETYGETHLRDSIAACKSAWDEAIYYAAGLPGPEAWTNRQKKLVHDMDARMQRAESVKILGPTSANHFPPSEKPKTKGEITPWPAMRADERFLAMAKELLTEERVVDQCSLAAIRRAI